MATLPPRAQDHQPVIVTFVWPSSSQYTGGVVVLYRMANALARRGAEVQFVHGPKTPWRVANVGEITWFDFDPAISHFVVDDVDDPSIPNSDVVMIPSAPARFGLPVSVIQGHRMVNPEWERANYRFRGLKVVVARWLAELGEEYGVPVEQMVHVPCGIEHDLFRVIVPLDRRPVDVAVLYNRHPSKAWTVARDALERVRIVRPELSVQVFGLADPAHDVPDWMQFAIADDRRVLAEEIFNCSKVLLQASWHEGFGLSAVEGMASGCALVTTDNGGSRDYATDRSTALVCDRGDAVGLAAAVVELLENDDLRHRIAAEGIARAGEFTSETSGDRLYRSLADYVADPGRFQAPLGPDRVQDPTVPEGWHLEELDLSASDETVDDGPRGVRVSAVRAHSPGSPREEELVWNIVWTGAVFDRLKYFVASQIAQSKSRFRFVVNGCEPGEVDKMEEFRAKHPDRVVEVMHVFDDMKAHGQALDVVLDSRDDGPCFCLIDPDIKASAPFVGDLLALLPGRGAVTSGKEIWSRDSVLPDGHPGVAGEFFIGSDGFVYGSPHLAIYDRRALLEVRDRWSVGLGSAGPDLPPETMVRLEKMGRSFLVYDTAKVVNVLLNGDDRPLIHRDLPQLLHIGGLSHYISPSGYMTTADGRREPEWARWERVAPRLEVARYTADLLSSMIDEREPAGLPDVDDEYLRTVLPMVREEVVDLVERYRSFV